MPKTHPYSASRRRILKSVTAGLAAIPFVDPLTHILARAGDASPLDVTFFVVGDTHFDPPPESDQYFHIHAMNRVCGSMAGQSAACWPVAIGGKPTGFSCASQPVHQPNGVILVGDITDKADPSALALLRTRYEQGPGDRQIHFPVYVGLGNHDLDPEAEPSDPGSLRRHMWSYVDSRHKGPDAPVPVTDFDAASHNYSWDWGRLHLVHCQRFAGDTRKGQTSSLPWLARDLAAHAADGRPVALFQHYPCDEWSNRWWTADERAALKSVLAPYNVIGLFAGHNHIATILRCEGLNVFEANNAWPEIGSGNNDGNGSFLIVHVSDSSLDVVTCRWLDDSGRTEFVGPFFTASLG